MAFDQPARRAMIPSIVPSNLVTNAMALSTGSMTATRIAGAAGAGLLISISGFEGAYVVMTVSYVGAVFFVETKGLSKNSKSTPPFRAAAVYRASSSSNFSF